MKKNLLESFQVNSPNEDDFKEVNPIFQDKIKLDNLRKKIIKNIIDNHYSSLVDPKVFISNEIEKCLEGYDFNNYERSLIHSLIEQEISGFGPLELLLKDKDITEIMVNSKDDIYIEVSGNLIKDNSVSFINDDHIIRTIQRLIEPVGRTVDAKNPFVDARLEDGSRLNAIIPPLSPKGPVLTIRKFKNDITSMDDLIGIGTLTPYMARFIDALIKGRFNILISGGSGSGKTTLLNVISSLIDNNERIITIEDAAELKLHQSHVVSLETRTSNYESNNEVTIRDLVINSLRMRPDRIIIGEVRGKEAFDMLQAMNTGHDGGITTLHANSSADALSRLESLVLMSGIDIPVASLREYISSAIDIVIHTDRLIDGKRKVIDISEVTGIKDGSITLNKIFSYTETGLSKNKDVLGEFKLHNKVPKIYKEIKKQDIDLDDMFGK